MSAPATPPLSPRPLAPPSAPPGPIPPVVTADETDSPNASRDDDPGELARRAGAPSDFFDAITLDLFRDPVRIASTGMVYERHAIESWIASGGRLCPATGLAIPEDAAVDDIIVPDDALRARILDFALRKCPEIVDRETCAIVPSAEMRAHYAAARRRQREKDEACALRAAARGVKETPSSRPPPPPSLGGVSERRTTNDVGLFVPSAVSEQEIPRIPRRRSSDGSSSDGCFFPGWFSFPPAYALVLFFHLLAFAARVGVPAAFATAPIAENPFVGADACALLAGGGSSSRSNASSSSSIEHAPYASSGAAFAESEGGFAAWSAFFASAFAHAGFVDLVAFCVFFGLVAPATERVLGPFWIAWFATVAPAAGATASAAFAPGKIFVAGFGALAATAAAALVAASAGLFADEERRRRQLMMMRTTTLVRLRNRGGDISPSDDAQFVAAAVRGPGVAKPLFVPFWSSALALFFAFALSLAPFHDPVGALVSTLVGASFAVLACWPELEARRRLPSFAKRLAAVAAAALLIAPAIAVARVENKGAAAAGSGGEALLDALPAKWRLAADASCPPALAEAANWSCDADEFYAFSRRPSPGGEGEEEAFVLAPRCGGSGGSSESPGGGGNDGDGIGGASGTPPTEEENDALPPRPAAPPPTRADDEDDDEEETRRRRATAAKRIRRRRSDESERWWWW